MSGSGDILDKESIDQFTMHRKIVKTNLRCIVNWSSKRTLLNVLNPLFHDSRFGLRLFFL